MVDIGETCRRMFEGVVTGSSSSPSRDLRAAEAMHLWQSILYYAETIVSAAAMSFVNGKHRWPECMTTVWMFVSHSLMLLTERTSHNIFYEYNNMHIPRVGSDMWGTDFGSHHWGNYMNDDRETILLLFSVILSAYARTHIVGKPQHPQNCLFSVCWLMTCTDDPHKKKTNKKWAWNRIYAKAGSRARPEVASKKTMAISVVSVLHEFHDKNTSICFNFLARRKYGMSITSGNGLPAVAYPKPCPHPPCAIFVFYFHAFCRIHSHPGSGAEFHAALNEFHMFIVLYVEFCGRTIADAAK